MVDYRDELLRCLYIACHGQHLFPSTTGHCSRPWRICRRCESVTHDLHDLSRAIADPCGGFRRCCGKAAGLHPGFYCVPWRQHWVGIATQLCGIAHPEMFAERGEQREHCPRLWRGRGYCHQCRAWQVYGNRWCWSHHWTIDWTLDRWPSHAISRLACSILVLHNRDRRLPNSLYLDGTRNWTKGCWKRIHKTSTMEHDAT